jgi:hypothetical protein
MTMTTNDDRDDGGACWANEYAAWCAEQDERAIETLNALLRAVGDGTVYDMRGTYDDQD